jgi:hypothetical protein
MMLGLAHQFGSKSPEPFPVTPQQVAQSLPQAEASPTHIPVTLAFSSDATLNELLPDGPISRPITGPVLTDNLADVPEVEFETRPAKVAGADQEAKRIANHLAKIHHLNSKQTDGFLIALQKRREDLAGLPFMMGDACRSNSERMEHFASSVALIREALTPNSNHCIAPGARTPEPKGQNPEIAIKARVAALMQLAVVESDRVRLDLVAYLSRLEHPDATQALAKLAIFSDEDEIRSLAIESLRTRNKKEYTDVLIGGLKYPWPAVARRAAETIAHLERADLVPELVALMSADADPRLPIEKEVDGESIAQVRELVKVNHLRNCMLCHSPGKVDEKVAARATFTAEVAVPGKSPPSPFQGYGQSPSSDLLIRFDVTYLRQDFSVKLPVSDAHPWPDLQRYDFFVRERKVSPAEAEFYRKKLKEEEAGRLSPYQLAAHSALQELTGKNALPTAVDWRRELKLPEPPG